jgi:hypothetical protein
MKKVRINAGFAGLVFRKRDFRKVLPEGTFWVSPANQVLILTFFIVLRF